MQNENYERSKRARVSTKVVYVSKFAYKKLRKNMCTMNVKLKRRCLHSKEF